MPESFTLARDPHPQRIAVTGVTGFIGTRLAEWLLAAGHEVIGFSRRPWGQHPAIASEHRRLLVFPDRPDPEDLSGCTAVIHLALSDRSLDPEVAARIDRSAAEHMYRSATEAGCRRFVFVSTQSAHADALNNYGTTKYQIERDLIDRPGVAIVRPGLVWDYEDGGLLGIAARLASTARVFPLLGGRAAVAQTVHVDDLSAVLADLAVGSAASATGVIEVARPEVEWLGDLITAKTRARYGKRIRVVPIGGTALRFAASAGRVVGVGGALSDVLLGIEGHRVMDTADTLQTNGWHLRGSDFVGTTAELAIDTPSWPVGLTVLGAGRMGLLHSLIARQRADIDLLGIVDPAPPAQVQARLMLGLNAPSARKATSALARRRASQPTAAIVATPPSAHAAALDSLDGSADAVLVEKPLTGPATPAGASSSETERLLVGYQFATASHVLAAAERLSAGAFGTPTAVNATTFVEKIDRNSVSSYWEWWPEKGGGALAGVGGHLLSMVWALLGQITVSAGRRDAQELAAQVHGTAGGVAMTMTVAVDAVGFAVPETSVAVTTTDGVLSISPTHATFRTTGGTVEWVSETRVGFDPAPLEGGAAYVAEMSRLIAAARVPIADTMPADPSVSAALAVERAVEEARRVSVSFDPPPSGTSQAGSAKAPGGSATPPNGCGLDLRRAPSTLRAELHPTAPVILGEAEFDRIGELGASRCVAVLPDLPAIFRALGAGGPLGLVRHFEPAHLAMAVAATSPSAATSPLGGLAALVGIGARTVSRSLPKAFDGTVILDGYVVDYLAAVGACADSVGVLAWMRRRFAHARIGIEARCGALLGRTLDVVAPLVDTVLLAGTDDTHPAWLDEWCATNDVRLVRTLAGLPSDVHAAQLERGGGRPPGSLCADWRWCGDVYRAQVAAQLRRFD